MSAIQQPALATRFELRRGSYLDSVRLLAISAKVRGIDGIAAASVAMATPANLDAARAAGLATPDDCSPNDLLVTVAGTDEACAAALASLDALLAPPPSPATPGEQAAESFRSLSQAARHRPEARLALISVPGAYAAAEARKALAAGLHVMLFSDNVSIEDEVLLKRIGAERGLLVMGPDCGTAIIDGVPLGFANAVRRGPIGVVGASGTGTQEVCTLVHRYGSGVSQVVGTGGRDLSAEVGGATMRQALAMLDADPSTEVIVLVSKPPHPTAQSALLELAEKASKPVIAAFLGATTAAKENRPGGGAAVRFAPTLSAAAAMALECVGVAVPAAAPSPPGLRAALAWRAGRPGMVVGAFCGGTFCHEAEILLEHAGVPAGATHLVDFGDDEFTVGRPHPMIDPDLRDAAIAAALDDERTAVVLFDVVLGEGAHDDPVSGLLGRLPDPLPRDVAMVAQVCGTDDDPQNRASVVGRLTARGIHVAPSNADAAGWAAHAVSAR